VVEGVPTVLPFHRAVLADPAFTGIAGARDGGADGPAGGAGTASDAGTTAAHGFAVHTQWIETELLASIDPQALAAPVTEPGIVETWVEIDGRRHRVRTPGGIGIGFGSGAAAGSGAAPAHGVPPTSGGVDDSGRVPLLPAMPGTLVRWLAADGETVSDGQPVAVVEAMKMESQLVAEAAGVLEHTAQEGAQITAGNPIGYISR
jgi:acetyl-CoA/propionyl-CoA carboxylase biotin carboxyl carrier protein